MKIKTYEVKKDITVNTNFSREHVYCHMRSFLFRFKAIKHKNKLNYRNEDDNIHYYVTIRILTI